MQGWSKGVLYSAVGLIGIGGLLLVLGWNGAANIDYTQGQIPFVISGGLGGLALVIAGVAMMVVHSIRQDLTRLNRQFDRVVDAISEAGGIGAVGGPTAVPSDLEGSVVAGRTTYHEPSCHLVEGREDLQVMSSADARERGLAPCRICTPNEATA